MTEYPAAVWAEEQKETQVEELKPLLLLDLTLILMLFFRHTKKFLVLPRRQGEKLPNLLYTAKSKGVVGCMKLRLLLFLADI